MLGIPFYWQQKKNTSHPCLPLLIDSRPIYRLTASQFNDCKLRNQGTNLCNQYKAQHTLTIAISSFKLKKSRNHKYKNDSIELFRRQVTYVRLSTCLMPRSTCLIPPSICLIISHGKNQAILNKSFSVVRLDYVRRLCSLHKIFIKIGCTFQGILFWFRSK